MADKVSYLLGTHENIFENIKLCDQNATAFIAINSAIIGGLYSANLLVIDATRIGLSLGSVSTFTCLVFGIFLAIKTIWPRGWRMAAAIQGGSLSIPWKIAQKHATLESFEKGLQTADEAQLISELCALVFARAKVNVAKHFPLIWSVRLSLFGWIGAVALIVSQSIRL